MTTSLFLQVSAAALILAVTVLLPNGALAQDCTSSVSTEIKVNETLPSSDVIAYVSAVITVDSTTTTGVVSSGGTPYIVVQDQAVSLGINNLVYPGTTTVLLSSNVGITGSPGSGFTVTAPASDTIAVGVATFPLDASALIAIQAEVSTWTATFVTNVPGLKITTFSFQADLYDKNGLISTPVPSGGNAGDPSKGTYLGTIAISDTISVNTLCTPTTVKGEPHFTAGDGTHFDWTGLPGHNYCLLSDTDVHINMGMTGGFFKWDSNPYKPLTWIRDLSFLWNGHSVILSARAGPQVKRLEGFMGSMQIDGENVVLDIGEKKTFANDQISLSYLSSSHQDGDDVVDLYEVSISDLLSVKLIVRPEVQELRTKEEANVHFDIEFTRIKLSSAAHGVLGQTFSSKFAKKSKAARKVFSEHLNWEMVEGENGAGLLEGHFGQYEVSSLVAADCDFTRYSVSKNVFGHAGALSSNSIHARASSRKLMMMM